ncbi:xylulose kinase [Labrys okinawensis]|uniref:Xylulose kinase n=1 Tax=Labrys okinawensis TaxID=346911 RepID=A0A2S9QBE6_9HYPH|nr:FGGY family carbohydrate kinase [Labrys okinawensis]PRH86676.1 xylulose kinase [Labrys okinawensis]
MGNKLLILDVGSTALKAVLYDRTGTAVASATRPLTTQTRSDGSVEQDAREWWAATQAAVSELPFRADVCAIGLAGSMQNLIAHSSAGKPTGPAILYSDRRLDQQEVAALGDRLPDDYGRRTGNHLDPAHSILKLMRLERFLPGLPLDAVAGFLFGAKDAVIRRLTGSSVIDPTTATTTGLYNIASGTWDETLLAAAGVGPAQMPKILAADALAGQLTAEAAAVLGLPRDIPVYNGAGDGAAATWGAFADAPNTAYAYIGTTGWVAGTMDLADARPPRDSYTLADPVEGGRAIVITPFLCAGAALDWLSDLTSLPVEALLDHAAAAGEAPHPLFLPYLFGERSPFEDRLVRGAFLGLDRGHGPGALCRAVLEGIAFAIRHNLEAAGLPCQPLTAIGGGARSPLQQRFLADALNRPVIVPAASQEMPALGIYRMLAPRLGFEPVRELAGGVTVEPHPSRAEAADRRYHSYRAGSDFARELPRTMP